MRSNNSQFNRVEEVVRYTHHNLKADLSIVRIADTVGLHQAHYRKLFQQVTGITAHQYVIQVRLEQTCHLLRHTDLNLSVIADKCGF